VAARLHGFGPGRFLSPVWATFNRLPPLVIDGLIAAVTATATITLLITGGGNPEDRPIGWVAYPLAVVIAAPLVVRRRRPLEAVLVMATLAIVYQLVESPAEAEDPQVFPLMLGLYAVGAYENRRWGLVLSFVAAATLVAFDADRPFISGAVGDLTWVIASLAVGAVVRGRRERAQLAEQRRTEEALRMVNEERLRIARELHDVVAHSIATISVQAGMAAHVFDTQPEEARTALREIRQVTRNALRELRATLGVLRSASGHDDERAPVPHLDQLGDLVARAEAAGIRVALSTSGAPRSLPAAVDLTAYRIVQEALTNVVRHAGAEARATVSITYLPDELELRVIDDGPPAGTRASGAGPGGKLGLLGMRERIAGVGGELAAGPRRGGGFEVRATLPTGERG
jgi:signal transduction histidine kinase